MSTQDTEQEQFIAALERELVTAAGRRARVTAAHIPRPRGSVAVPVAVVAVALAIGASALLLARSKERGAPAPATAVGRRGRAAARPTRPPRRANSAQAAVVPAMIGAPVLDNPLLRALVGPGRPLAAVLGVLRRRQDAADRTMPALAFTPGHILPSLTRLLASAGGRRLYLAVLAPPHGRASRAPAGGRSSGALSALTVGSTRLCLVVAGADGFQTCAPAEAQLTGPPWNDSPYPGGYAQLVPDGVVRVRWVFQSAAGGPRRITVTPTLSGNVAYASNLLQEGSPLSVTWYLAGGRAVQELSQSPMRLWILAGDGIGSLYFGASPARARRYLSALLGRPSLRYHATSACRIDHVIRWPGLIALFSSGRFVGYSAGPRSRAPAGLPRLYTTRGLGIGHTIARARRLYRAAFRVSAEQGGSWLVRTPHGSIDGFATGVRSGRIVTIEAGDVGCPAMTP